VLGNNMIKEIKIDENKTVICFTALKETQEKELGELVSKT
jgi:hypothetical protein